MTSRPTVTVVIPCYNQGHFLPAAIASVRAQTFEGERLQLIVVDDGSTDDTARVAGRLGAEVIEQANRGLSPARNAGLRAAAGEFVVFLDADDELLPDAIATGIARFDERPALACILRYCLLIDEYGLPVPTRPPEIERSDIYVLARASSRFATFAHATKRTQHPAANNINSAGRNAAGYVFSEIDNLYQSSPLLFAG